MWNVYQYLKDFVDDKVNYNDFINIYRAQRPLKSYISDCYNDIISHKLIDEYKALNGIIFPTSNYQNIDEFIINNKDINNLKDTLKALVILIDRIYK